MPFRKSHKRRRTEAFVEPEVEPSNPQDQPQEDPPVASIEEQPAEQPSSSENPDTNDQEEIAELETLEKDQELWDAFREEYYEVLEQLPLSLHRSFSLMRELDQQVQGKSSLLVSTLRQYILQRRELAKRHQDSSNGSASMDVDPPPDASTDRPSSPARGSPPRRSQSPSQSQRPRDTRQLLTTIASASEDIVRSSNEKLSLARFSYDLVDRYIRDLNRAITEEETALSIGMRPGTHPASIILPEVVAPTLKPHRPAVQTPVPEAPVAPPAEPVPEEQPMKEQTPAPRRKSRRRTAEKQPSTEKSASPSRKLKLTVPPLASVTNQTVQQSDAQDAADQNKLYCLCNRPSEGDMIACDNPTCEREWFHYACVGITEDPPPNLKWYCPNCQPVTRRRR
ncbi:hypothetical protein K474DRAFT_1699040 [Panus rudis PR-1116 ss-1]|nr:hypothetical protein K474DRAFT_1699040 [Panus rudis PR-1116 ss-1]